VGDATLTFENSDPLRFALFGVEVLKQPPPIAQQHRDPGVGSSLSGLSALAS
jgi:hypothetical protein